MNLTIILVVLSAGAIVLIFHEIGHWIVGKLYGLEPVFTWKKLYRIWHPYVEVKRGALPNKWSVLGGFLFSFGGYPIFQIVLAVFDVSGEMTFWLTIFYGILCLLSFTGVPPVYYKGLDLYLFMNFDRLKEEKV
jgi:hypothetical protein